MFRHLTSQLRLIGIITLTLLFAYPAYAGNTDNVKPQLGKLLRDAINDADSFDDKFAAEVWLLDMNNRLKPYIKNDKERVTILKRVHYEATRAKLEPRLVLAVMEVESRFDRFAVSRSGALGLMQIMPFWLKEIGRPNDNLFHINTNLRMGCTILKYYLDIESGNLHRALGRYNGSLGKRKYPDKIFTALRKHWYRG
ncbi:MAG: lytic transglycosylase domain-containing protein [Gammaproteobacteria bacterium]|nr:lytic transglycosylase domain-containing protein [Gammaproteobacteria bacterium]